MEHARAAATVPEVARDSEFSPVTLGKFFEITPLGLKVHGTPDFETCEQLWSALKTLEKGIQFAIGDAVRYIEARFGERAAQIIHAATGWSDSTVRAYTWVAERVPAENRMMDRGLSYSHHQKVAKLGHGEQKTWLRKALQDEKPWTVSRLGQEIKAQGELVETGWFVLVDCGSAKKRDGLLKRLEIEGFACRAETRREVR